MINVLLQVLFFDFGIGAMSTEILFGLKIVALVMVYGYMHMNLGGWDTFHSSLPYLRLLLRLCGRGYIINHNISAVLPNDTRLRYTVGR